MIKDITAEDFIISKKDRNKLNGHDSFFILFTGFSGSGKSTLAKNLDVLLNKKSLRTYCLDGDNIRKGINNNLSFSPEDRSENLRRVAEVSKLFIDAGLITIASFVAPYEKDRNRMKEIIGTRNCFEVHVSTSIDECERRDVKGLYAKVRKGEIKNFTGIDAPYEIPLKPNMSLDTENSNIADLIDKIYFQLKERFNL